MRKTISVLVMTAIMTATAFGADGDKFTIKTSNGLEMTETSKRARVFMATDDLWDFRGFGLELRVSARKLADEPASETTVFGGRNTIMFFYTKVDGKRSRIACDGGDDPRGWMKRAELTETLVAGAFQVELIRCREFYTGEDLRLDALPILVEGTFRVMRKGFP